MQYVRRIGAAMCIQSAVLGRTNPRWRQIVAVDDVQDDGRFASDDTLELTRAPQNSLQISVTAIKQATLPGSPMAGG